MKEVPQILTKHSSAKRLDVVTEQTTFDRLCRKAPKLEKNLMDIQKFQVDIQTYYKMDMDDDDDADQDEIEREKVRKKKLQFIAEATRLGQSDGRYCR